MSGNLLSTNNEEEELLNPFVHHLELTSTYEKIKTGLFTIFILPIRLAIIAGLLIVAWCFACVALVGLTEKELIERPLRGWRRLIREWICILGRMVYYAGGMHLSINGKQASRKHAPILVVAPHSTFMDAVVVYVTGFPSILVRKESGMNPWLRKLINVTQPVYVRRDDPDSRQRTIQDIIDRAKSDLDWSQVLIFPEGTCTNRSCLITFKSGAFYPGVAVQPVLLRYPNKFDTVTWTWDGPGALKLLWLTLTQLHCNCEIEFLPVYVPNELEKLDPKLYAHNVRNLMANALGVPTSEYSYEDCKLVKMARDLSLPPNSILMQTQRMRNRLGLTRKHIEEEMIDEHIGIVKEDHFISVDEFADLLHVHKTDHELIHLFQLHSLDGVSLNLRKYLLCVLLASKAVTKHDMILLAFKVHDYRLDKDTFKFIMKIVNCDYEKYFNEFYSHKPLLNYDTFEKIVKENNEEYNEKNIDLFKKSE